VDEWQLSDDELTEYQEKKEKAMVEEFDDDDIFGGLDVSDVSDDPFKVDDDTYPCEVTSCKVETNEMGKRYLYLNWKINTPGEPFDKVGLRNRLEIFPFDANGKPVPKELWDADVIRGMANFMKLLREGFDLSEGERNKFSPKMAVGTEMYCVVKNRPSKTEGDTRVFANVVATLSPRLFAERDTSNGSRGQAADQVASDLGM